MPFPPWTRDLLSGSLDDVAKKLQNLETVKELQSRASTLLGDLPIAAARGLDRILQETRKGTDHLRRWVRRQTTLNLSVINGSGVYFHPLLEGSPIHDDAAEKLVRAGDYFSFAGGTAAQRIEQRLAAEIEKHVGCSSLFVQSVPAALLAIAASGKSDAAVIVPRAHSIRLADGSLIPDLFGASGRRVLEIGSSTQYSTDDWNSALRDASANSIAFEICWPEANVRSDIAASKNDFANPPESLRRVQLLPYGCFALPTGLAECGTLIDSALIESNWLTVVPTHALLAGPRGALVLGSKSAIESVVQTKIWPALKGNLHDKAALAVALENNASEAGPKASLESLLTVSVENLQNRAERLATQLAGDSSFASCRISQEPARLGQELAANIPSRQLVITPVGNSQKLYDRLLAEAPALLVELVGNELKLDFRWIPSHLDAGLAGLLGEQPVAEADESVTNSEIS